MRPILKLNHIGYDSQRINPFLTDQDIEAIYNSNEYVINFSKLKFKKCHLISNHGYKIFFSKFHLKNIKMIEFNNCAYFNDETLELLANHISNMDIQQLAIKDILRISERYLEDLLQKPEIINIQKFNISKCPAFNDNFIMKLSSCSNLINITHLKLSFLNLTNKAIDNLCHSNIVNNVRYLNISGCDLVDQQGLDYIINSNVLTNLQILILDHMDQINSLMLKELLDSNHGPNLKALSLFDCNQIDDKIFSYLAQTNKATSITYLTLMSKSIKNWRSLIPYFHCDNAKSLQIFKFYESFNQNEYAMDQIDQALASSKTLTNLNVISLASNAKLKAFLKSANAKNLKTVEFISYSMTSDKGTFTGTKKLHQKEMRSYLQYHRDKSFQSEDFFADIEENRRFLMSDNNNISADTSNQAEFFENLKILTLVKITNSDLLKKILLEYDHSKLEVLQVIQCNNLEWLIELLHSNELKNLHTLNISLINSKNKDDNPKDIINKISRCKLPKLHTLVINDQSSYFKDIENLLISPIIDNVRILKLKTSSISESSTKKLSECFRPKSLQKLKIPEVDINFLRISLTKIKQYFQLYIKDIIDNSNNINSPINTNHFMSIDMENPDKIIIPINVEIITSELTYKIINLINHDKNNNIKCNIKNGEINKLLKLDQGAIEKATKYIVPCMNSFNLDETSRMDGIKDFNKIRPLLARILRIKQLMITWDFEKASHAIDLLYDCQIQYFKMSGEVNKAFFHAITKFDYLEELSIQSELADDMTKLDFESFIKSNTCKNLIKLKICKTEWFNEEYISVLIAKSIHLNKLKLLHLTQNKNILSKSLVKIIKKSKFKNIRDFEIGDLKSDFRLWNKDILDILNQKFFMNIISFRFDSFHSISVPNIQEITNIKNNLLKVNNPTCRIEIMKLLLIRLLESHIAQDQLLPLLNEIFYIIKNDPSVLKKIKMNGLLVKTLLNNNSNNSNNPSKSNSFLLNNDSDSFDLYVNGNINNNIINIYYDPYIVCSLHYKYLSENNRLINDDILDLFIQKKLIKYMLKTWGNFEKVSYDGFCKIIQNIHKSKHLKELITNMNYKFFIDDILLAILNNKYIEELSPEWLLDKFTNCSKHILIKILKLPNAKFTLDFYLNFCDQLKSSGKNVGELAMYDVPSIKKLTSLSDVFIEKILNYFISNTNEQSSIQKLIEIYPEIFNINADDLTFSSLYSYTFLYIFKNSIHFNHIQKLSIHVDPSLMLDVADESFLNGIIELNLYNCSLNDEIKWLDNMKNLKILRLNSITHDYNIIEYIMQIELKIEELELHNLKSDNKEFLDDVWVDALKTLQCLKRLTLSKLKISVNKLDELFKEDILSNIQALAIKYLPFYCIKHLKVLGSYQPELKHFELGLHQITNQYIEVIAKNPNLTKLEVFQLHCKDNSVNFLTGFAYILHSSMLTSFQYDEFFTKNTQYLTDELVHIALKLKVITKFKKLDITKSNISTQTFIKILNSLKVDINELKNIIEIHSFCSFFTNDMYSKLLEVEYNEVIASIDLDKVANKLKMSFIKQVVGKQITQYSIRRLLSDFHEQINDDFIDFFIKLRLPIIEAGIIIQLNSKLHINVNNLKLNQLITSFPYPNFPLAYEWVIMDPHWNNMLEYESLKVFIDSIQDYFLVFPKNTIDFENNIYLTSNGNVQILQEVTKKSNSIYTQYLDDKFQKWENEVFNDRYNYFTLKKDDDCGDVIIKLLEHTPFLETLNLKSKNFGDTLCRRLASSLMEKNQKGVQFLEVINLNDNPRITNIGMKHLYTAIIMDQTLTNVDVYCSQNVRKSNLDIALSNGIHDTLKYKYQSYYKDYKKKGLHVYDDLCIPIFIYSILCFPLALLQCFEDALIKLVKKSKLLKKFYKCLSQTKKKIFKERTVRYSIILDQDTRKAEKFLFTENCYKLNNYLGNPLIWELFLVHAIIYYFICFFAPIQFYLDCQDGISWLAYLMYAIYAILSGIFEFYLIQKTKLEIADPAVFDMSIIGMLVSIILSILGRFNLFTNMLFMTTVFDCGYNDIGTASLFFIILYALFNWVQIIFILYRHITMKKAKFYDSNLSRLSIYAYAIEFKAISTIFEKFAAFSAIKIGEYYIPQIMVKNFLRFLLESFPQGILQFTKLIRYGGANSVSTLALIETLINFIMMFNGVMRIKPSLCTPEMINELSRSTRGYKNLSDQDIQRRLLPTKSTVRINRRESKNPDIRIETESLLKKRNIMTIMDNDNTIERTDQRSPAHDSLRNIMPIQPDQSKINNKTLITQTGKDEDLEYLDENISTNKQNFQIPLFNKD